MRNSPLFFADFNFRLSNDESVVQWLRLQFTYSVRVIQISIFPLLLDV